MKFRHGLYRCACGERAVRIVKLQNRSATWVERLCVTCEPSDGVVVSDKQIT